MTEEPRKQIPEETAGRLFGDRAGGASSDDSYEVAVQRIESALLARARTLNLSRLGLAEIPPAFEQLTDLEVLDVSCNQVSALPDTAGKLRRLKQLVLHHNELEELPEFLTDLPRLQILNVADNLLRCLPEGLGRLSELRELYVGGNRLQNLPESTARLTKLEKIGLSRNHLASLPDWLGAFDRLSLLAAHTNFLSTLPNSLRPLRRLTQLLLHGNARLRLPPEVLGPTWETVVTENAKPTNPAALLDYYFQAGRPSNEAKVLLLGRGGVGKTSLVNRLVHSRYNPKETKTDGIAITPWGVKTGQDEVRLNIWDFGGQEIMHATHQFFLTKRSLYVLVLNAREGEQDANVEYWLRLIQSFGGDSPVLIVINKACAHAFDLNRRGLKEKFPAIQDFLQTDCESEHGLKELRQAILRETDRLEHLRDPFPASWFSVKDTLAHLRERVGENFIPFARYQQLCAEQGVKEAVSQETLVGFLHDLGIVVNFRDDPRLAETHVLNPEWVTNGIHKVLNDPQLAAQHGELRLVDLARVLDQKDYPQKMHLYLLDLMRKFELCYEMHDGDGHYLVPELLGKEEPDLGEFAGAEALRFNYRYNILPEGLLPRFIVRSRALNKNLPRWRTGVVVAWEGNRAVVKADLQDRTVSIAVVGDGAGRRRLLTVIRADLEVIHRCITKLEATEEVPVPGQAGLAVGYATLCVLEAEGETELKLVHNGKLVKVKIADLLNGVEEASARSCEPMRQAGAREGVRVAFSYSHKDEELRDRLETHLKLLQRQGVISTWHDRKIMPGDKWAGVIDDNFKRAEMILLLVSVDFLAWDYCYEIEMKAALEREAKREARVVPVILRMCDWASAPFAMLQALPKDGKPVMKWADRDEAWTDVEKGIKKVAEELRSRGR